MSTTRSTYEGKQIFTREFICPYCLVAAPYKTKCMSKEITIYPIPFLQKKDLRRAIECQVCKYAFDPEILNYSKQCLFKLAEAAKYQLDTGISPGHLKLQ